MRFVVRKQPGQIGATVGAVGAAGAVTAAGMPELIPVAVPVGAKAGEISEQAVREVFRQQYSDPPTSGPSRAFEKFLGDLAPAQQSQVCTIIPKTWSDVYGELSREVNLKHTTDADRLIEEIKFLEHAISTCQSRTGRVPLAPAGVG
jgi:hypothetical protein